MDDFQEPDGARPAKRVRLKAPLQITEDLQDEIIENEEDWDDIYGVSAEEATDSSPSHALTGGVSLHQADAVESSSPLGQSTADAEDGVPPETVDDTDGLDVHRAPVVPTDVQSAKVIAETMQVEAESPYHIDSPPIEQEGENETNGLINDQPQEQMGNGSTSDVVHDDAKPQTSISSAPPRLHEDAQFLEAAAAQKNNKEAEWQFDSSDAASSDSDSDSSSDDSDESDSGSEGGYELLDPTTAAKMLMAGDGEDEDGDKSKDKSNGDHQPRTANETKEEVVPKPDVVVTADMEIVHLGTIDRIVDNQILIKAVTPGEYQVLEYGSVLCTENREVIGAVADTMGRVQEPIYSVIFTNAQEIADAGLEFGTKVFYVHKHSTFVFTQPLKNLKGTDASNIHDEEVGEDELEFSDDEKEAEFKRLKKAAKKEGRGVLSRGAYNDAKASGHFPGTTDYDRGHSFNNRSDAPQQNYGSGISYDDVDVQEEFYSPLKRPENLSQLMAGGGPPPPRPQFGGFERGRARGRGDRGRGRGDRGRGRGGFDHRNQRGGRGGHNYDRGADRGHRGQQNGHRGSAHSYPDRHNEYKANGRSPPRSSPPQNSPRQSSQHPQYQTHSQQQQPPPSPQTYQFNGYTFQYGNPPPQPPAYNQQQPPTAPNSSPPLPAGSYVNPAFYQNQQQWLPAQAQATYAAWQQAQNPQPPVQQPQYPNAGYSAATPQTSHQQPDLAAILRQLGGR